MDNLSYHYTAGTNRLDHIGETIPAGRYTEGIDDKNPANYHYDEIGNLVRDSSAKLWDIRWNLYGKIRSINKNGTLINYTYDASGNRIVGIPES